MFAPAKFQGMSTPQQESRNTTSILWTRVRANGHGSTTHRGTTMQLAAWATPRR